MNAIAGASPALACKMVMGKHSKTPISMLAYTCVRHTYIMPAYTVGAS